MRAIFLIMVGFGVLSANFIKNANIVTDFDTGLQWQDDTVVGPMNWKAAIDYCEELSLDGYIDWRLPNIKELRTLVDEEKSKPAIYPVFQYVASESYWSSTTPAYDTTSACYVYFYNGSGSLVNKYDNNNVRCVRAGK